jgi:hypothetical protein
MVLRRDRVLLSARTQVGEGVNGGVSNWHLVEDCGGLIEEIAMAIPPRLLHGLEASDAGALNVLSNLIAAFELGMKLHLFVETADRTSAQGWLEKLEPRCACDIVGVENGCMGSTAFWIQDAVHVRVSNDSRRFDRAFSENGGRHADWLAAHFGTPVGQFSMHLAGGNQLVGRDFRLVGMRSLELSSWPSLGGNGEICDAYERIARVDPRPLHVFGYRPGDLEGSVRDQAKSLLGRNAPRQCSFHLDLFVSLTGLVRDGRPLLVVADPISTTHPAAKKVVNAKRELDASVARLVARGFAVERNPVPYAVSPTTHKLVPCLYNNVLIENALRPDRLKPLVWLPCFGSELDAFDAENAGIWQDLGFDVMRVHGWNALAGSNGALRCATKVVKRMSGQG